MAAWQCTCIFLLLHIFSTYGQQSYRICAKKGLEDVCKQLGRERDGTDRCEFSLHEIDYVQNIQNGKSDIGTITAEQALIAANFVQDVVVVGEVRSESINEDSLYATVVVVKQDFTGGFANLRGKKFCHPGFKYKEAVSELLLKEFERIALKKNNVDGCSSSVSSDTLLEKELKSVYEFFGPSCRPGPWTEVDELNKDFYSRYERLCELCNTPDKCTAPSSGAPFMYSLDCLLRVDGGDVALTTLNTIQEFFGESANQNKKQNYRYLCRDGSIQTLDNPCVWSKQPWNLIVTHRNQVDNAVSYLKKHLWDSIINKPSGGTPPTASSKTNLLKGLLLPDKGFDNIYLVDKVPLQKYMTDRRVSIPNPKESTLCGQQIRWCTISDQEQQKCLWLAQASLDRAVQPVVDCVKSTSKLACLEDMKNNKVDIVTSDAHYGYIARKKGLLPIAYPETEAKDVIQTLLVVKNKDTSSMRKFEDLKDKKACFPEYGGIEWLSFINHARNFLPSTCDYGELTHEFVGESCIPGIRNPEHEVSSKVNKDKLCQLCLPITTGTAVTCNADETNVYYGNIGALKCLKDSGDFAVISKEDFRDIDPNEFRVLCLNGTLAANTGFNVDFGCSLSVTVDGEVVARRKDPKIKDIGVVLYTFERRFGRDPNKPFQVFNEFNGILDLLFKDSTPGLVKTNSENIFVKNYVNLFAHTNQCYKDELPAPPTNPEEPGGATALQTPIVTILTIVLIFLYKLVF